MLPIVLFQKTEKLRQCRFFVVFDPPPTNSSGLGKCVHEPFKSPYPLIQ